MNNRPTGKPRRISVIIGAIFFAGYLALSLKSNLLGYLIVVTITGLTVFLILKFRMSSKQNIDGPIISGLGMLGANGLESVNVGDIAGFQYNLLTNDLDRVMVLVQLGHNSSSHMLAYGDKSLLDEEVKMTIKNRFLEPAVLEGDFPDYFKMYCNPGLQIVLRELFTPDVMANFVDFCRSYDFELFGEVVYFSRAGDAVDADDQTTLVSDVTVFLQKNGDLLKRINPGV